MPVHHSDAYVLRTYTLKEADKICVLLTRDAGRIRGVAQGARRLRSRFGSSLEPFTDVAVTYLQKENRELVSISSCEIIRSQFAADLNSDLLGLLHYLAEMIIEFVPDHEPNERVYRLVSSVMDVLSQNDASQIPALTRYCEIWMLRLSGFLPDGHRCSSCKADVSPDEPVWLISEGAIRCAECSHKRGYEIRPPARAIIADILKLGPKAFVAVPRDPRALKQVASLASRLIQHTLERELKSIEIISRLESIGNSFSRN